MLSAFFQDFAQRLAYFLLLTFAAVLGLSAQTAISLEEAITLAKQSNHSVLIASKSIEIQAANLEQSKARFLPSVGMQASNVVTNNPLNVFGAKLLQASVQQEDFNPVLLNDPGSLNNLNVAVNAMMLLYDPEARAQHNAAKSQVSMKQAMAQRTQEGIELEVIKAYYTLILTKESVAVLEQTVAAAVSTYEEAKNYFDQGLMLKADLLDLQVMVNQSELSLASAKTSFANAQSSFNFVLNTDTAVDFVPSEDLVEVNALRVNEGVLNPNRADLQAMKYGIDALGHLSEATKMSFYPKLQAFGSYGINSEVPLVDMADNYQVGIQLRWGLYQGNMRTSSHVRAKAEREEKVLALNKMKDQAALDIENTKREITDLISQLSLHDLSIEQIEEALRIRKNRFSQGLDKSTDIISSETQLSQRRLARLNSLYALNLKSAYLDLLLK